MRAFIKTFSILMSICVVLPGCARRIGGDHYSQASVGEASTTYQGTVLSKRTVTVGQEQLGDNAAGMLGGGLLGGIGGAQLGSGGWNTAATIGGAALGALAGTFAEDKLKKQDAVEYVVRLNNGSVRTVVQGMDPVIEMNQRVLLIVGQNARSRVIPDHSNSNETQHLEASQKRVEIVHSAKRSAY